MLGAMGSRYQTPHFSYRLIFPEALSQALNTLFGQETVPGQGTVLGQRALLHPSRTGELAVQSYSISWLAAVRGQPWTSLAAGMSLIDPYSCLFLLENSPDRKVWKAA